MIRTGRSWVLFAWLLAMLFSPHALAARLDVPEIRAPVTDLANVVSQPDEAEIRGRLEEHRAATGVQIAVLTIRTTGGVPIEDYALEVATQWGGGSSEADDGALFVLAVDDRQMRLELGYGLEAKIPDAQARRLLDSAIPHLRRKDYANAILWVVEGVIALTGGTSRADEPIVPAAADPIAVDPMESWTPDVTIDSQPVVFYRPSGPDMGVVTALSVIFGIAIGIVGMMLRHRADAQRLRAAAVKEEEGRVADWDLPPLGMHVVGLLVVVFGVGAIFFAIGLGVAAWFTGLLGATAGYLILPSLSQTTAFSGDGAWSDSSSRSSSSWSSSRFGSSSGSSFGRSSSIGSSRSSWSGGGGRFGGGGATSRW